MVELVLDVPADQTGALKAKYEIMLGEGAVVEPGGKSVAIRIRKLPRIDIRQEFKDQIVAVRKGLRAAYRLQAISRFIQFPLDTGQPHAG